MRPRKEPSQEYEFVSPGAKAFGGMLRFYREVAGLSQRKVAATLGMTESTIARLESGQRNPPLEQDFYEKLYNLPGISTLYVQAMLDSDGAPEWFKEIRRERMLLLHPPFALIDANAQGVHLTIEVVPTTSQAIEELSQPDEISDLLRFLKRGVEEVVIPNAISRLQQDRANRQKVKQLLEE
ncbi:helix-turn-helix domain-containing protein [Candidatus Daviesbacteria bacterium]|nr:helix-turn-helix domain-containing protein [Candidatus Daviesbacteria bacterium]